jgi:hypothetical protein
MASGHRFTVSTRSSSEWRLLFGRFRGKPDISQRLPKSRFMSTRTKVVLTKLAVFSPNDLVDDRLCVLIPMRCPAAVTNLEGDFGTTKDIALIGSLAETNPFMASGDVATLAKIAALHLCASDMVDGQRPTSVSPPCVNCFTQSAQIRHAIVRSFFWDRPRSR